MEKDPFILPGENILDDTYPMHAGYVYLVNGVVWECPASTSVGVQKTILLRSNPSFESVEIRNCRIFARADKLSAKKNPQ